MTSVYDRTDWTFLENAEADSAPSIISLPHEPYLIDHECATWWE